MDDELDLPFQWITPKLWWAISALFWAATVSIIHWVGGAFGGIVLLSGLWYMMSVWLITGHVTVVSIFYLITSFVYVIFFPTR